MCDAAKLCIIKNRTFFENCSCFGSHSNNCITDKCKGRLILTIRTKGMADQQNVWNLIQLLHPIFPSGDVDSRFISFLLTQY